MSPLTRRDWLRAASVAAVSPAVLSVLPARAAAAPPAADVKAVLDKAVAFLKTRQGEDGSIAPKLGGPGITALVVAGVLRTGGRPTDPVVAAGLKYLESNIRPDGGVYQQRLANYTTCLAIVAFKEANAGGKYEKQIAAATKFVKSLQYGEETKPDDLNYGGVGYDGKGRPDVSNTQFLVEALTAAGAGKDDLNVRRAVTYMTRSQNLPGENKQPFAEKASDDDKGGFVYNPSDQDNAKSNKRTAAGGLRSEGGMTYAGLKTFLYAGVAKDDPRVKAAVDWIRRHYTLTENPGMGLAGLYYYYHTFAKAMDALGEEAFADARGVKHEWRQELFDELKKRQKADGSWANTNATFFESEPELATAFAVLALSYCTKK